MIVCSCGTIMNVDKTGVFEATEGNPAWAADRLACRGCGAMCFQVWPAEERYSGWAAECVLKFREGKP